MAALQGPLPEFSGAANEWEIFVKQLTHYFVANGIDDAAKQRATLLSACKMATYKLLRTLVAPAALTIKTFDELVGLAREHHNPKPSVIMRRFLFNTQYVCPSARRDNHKLRRTAPGPRITLRVRRVGQGADTRLPRLTASAASATMHSSAT